MSESKSPQLPLLPGYTFDLSNRKSFPRKQVFQVQDGVMVTEPRPVTQAVNAQESSLDLCKGAFTYEVPEYKTRTGSLVKPSERSSPLTAFANEASLPQWLANDGKVLCFRAYFKESVHSSPLENYRVRHCNVLFFLADGSMQVNEPRTENSGIPQGVLLKRGRVAKPGAAAGGAFYGVEDLSIGAELPIYGRVFRLVDADPATRRWYAARGTELGAAEVAPSDPYSETQAAKASKTDHRMKMNAQKQFVEANLGNGIVNVEATVKFLKNDGRVLRFFCLWRDPSAHGERHPYVLHYFLADDTVAVNEVRGASGGHEQFPALLKRQRLPKDFRKTVANVATVGAVQSENQAEFYSPADLSVGGTVNVFGRELLICSADKFTIDFYVQQLGRSEADFAPLAMDEPARPLPRMEVPPYNGYGSEEDSLGSFTHLVPKPPRQDLKKLLEKDGQNLRFVAKFTNAAVEDAERRFVVTYFMATETVSVFERVVRNSGFVGGKFLDRVKADGATGKPFQEAAFFVGAQLNINKHLFTLLDADEYTLQHMEAHPQTFPQADAARVIGLVKQQGLTAAALPKIFGAAQTVDRAAFAAALAKAGSQLTQQETITLARACQEKDGSVSLAKLAAAL